MTTRIAIDWDQRGARPNIIVGTDLQWSVNSHDGWVEIRDARRLISVAALADVAGLSDVSGPEAVPLVRFHT